jgi:hypothetical protein
MEKEHYITATQFCHHYGVEFSFISALHQSGLIQMVEEEEPLIPVEQLTDLEKYTRLHYELQINPEGIEAITYLLQRMTQMEKELQVLKARLRLYERDDA